MRWYQRQFSGVPFKGGWRPVQTFEIGLRDANGSFGEELHGFPRTRRKLQRDDPQATYRLCRDGAARKEAEGVAPTRKTGPGLHSVTTLSASRPKKRLAKPNKISKLASGVAAGAASLFPTPVTITDLGTVFYFRHCS